MIDSFRRRKQCFQNHSTMHSQAEESSLTPIAMDAVPKKWAIVPFTFFQIIALSTNIYIVPQLVISKVCYKMFNHTVCSQLGEPKFKTQENHVYNEAAAWNALINFAGFFPSLIIILPLGAMADLVSKKNMLFIPAIANLILSLINLFSAMFVTLHMGFLVLASFLLCVFADAPGLLMLCSIYATGASSEDRTLVLTAVISTCDFGFAAGGLIGNYLARYLGFSSVFLLVATELIICLLYTVILIPPLDVVDEKTSHGEQYDLWNNIKEHTKDTCLHLASFIKKHLLFSKDNTILLLVIAAFFNYASYGGERALITFFLKHSPLNFQPDKIGIYLTFYSCSRAIGLLVLVFLVKSCFPDSDYAQMLIGTVSMIICYTFLSFSKSLYMAIFSTIFAIPNSFTPPSVRSQLTKLVSAEESGVVLSLYGFCTGTSMFIMSVAANGLFVATVHIYSGFSILSMSFANLVAFVILCYIVCTKRQKGITISNYSKITNDNSIS